FFSSRRRHTRSKRDWSSDVCSSDLPWSVMASKVLNAMLDPEAHYKEFGGFDNMLVSVAGWLFRQTNSIEITANWVEQVNATGSRSEERRVGKECRYGMGARY